MELIPILSTIILVATICTFILAIGAYILYKIREGKQQAAYYSKPSSVKAELVVPGESPASQEVYQERRQQKHQQTGITQDIFHPDRKPSQSHYTPEPRGYKFTEEKFSQERGRAKEKLTDENKFLKYTSEGYVSPKEDRISEAVKWR